MNKYKNRSEAGQILSRSFQLYANDPDALVLALPRGGVPIAYEIAKSLFLPLNIFIVRKLPTPGYDELALGAIVMGGFTIFNDDVIKILGISQHEIAHIIAKENQELTRRIRCYQDNKPSLNLKNKKIILVDDGIATGATMRIAIHALRKYQCASIVVAVPVSAKVTYDAMALLADNIVCPLLPMQFYSVGAYYIDFAQVTDNEVYESLNKLEK